VVIKKLEAQLAMGDHEGDGLVIGYCLILPIKMVHSDALFVLFCTVNWLMWR